MPPAMMTSASPAMIIAAAMLTDFRPLPQTLLMVIAGTDSGMPAWIAA